MSRVIHSTDYGDPVRRRYYGERINVSAAVFVSV